MNREQKEEDKMQIVEGSVSSSNGPEPSTVDGWMSMKPKYSDDSKDSKTVQSRVTMDSEVYDMSHTRRGVAVIFNNVYFKRNPIRKGSEKDCKDITQTLLNLDFEVRIYKDPTIDIISTVLKKTAAEDHTDADCLIVMAMTHGESGLLHAIDGLYPVNKLWAQFTGDRCPTLVGKPKLIFIQACRGTQLDKGVKIIHQTDSVPTFYSIPTYADIMVAYSSYDGFFSWRNPDSGAWFIQALCEELNLHGRNRDLLTMMTFINRRVAINYQSFVPHDKHFHEKKQIPSFVSMLTRLVYFPKKESNDSTTQIEHKTGKI